MIDITITNNSGLDQPTYLYILGESLTTKQLGYANASGQFSPWPGAGLPPVEAPDVSIPGPANGQSATIKLPRLSGRVYFSFGQKIPFKIVGTPNGTGLVQPAPWAANDPSKDINFDWSEYTLNDGGLWLNSSQVDMFAVPHAVGVKHPDGSVNTTGRLKANGRSTFFGELASQPGGWGNLVYSGPDGKALRAIAPGKGIDAGVLDKDVLQPYIDKAWDAYRTKTLTIQPFDHEPHKKFFGNVVGNEMRFTTWDGQAGPTIQKPNSAGVFGCDGALTAINDHVQGPIVRTLCAALHRGTLHSVTTQPDKNVAGFYQETVTNHYARRIHSQMADGKAYAFAFDDVAAQESLVHSGDPKHAYITLDPFN